MARVELAASFKSIHGSKGGMVFYSYNGRHYIRSRVTPRNPNTEAQVFVRRRFGDAVRAWQALGDEQKRRYNRRARMRSGKGYNLFISEYVKERMPSSRIVNAKGLLSAVKGPSSPEHLRNSSVPVPLLPHQGSFSTPERMIRDKIPA